MTIATLIRKTFNWGGSLIVPKVQSVIIMMGSMETCKQTWCWLQLVGNREGSVAAGVLLSITELKGHSYSDTLPPTRPYLLIVSFPLESIFFQTTTRISIACNI